MKITREDVNALWNKIKIGIKKVNSTVSTKTKDVVAKTKDNITAKIDNSKKEKEIKHNKELEEYKNIIQTTKNGIKDTDVLMFLEGLGDSPYEIYKKSVNKIKETFPIPKEQTVLWSLFVTETNRTGDRKSVV